MTANANIDEVFASASIAMCNYKRMALINDEYAFRRLVQNYDLLTGVGSQLRTVQEIISKQETAAFYFDTTITVLMETKLTLQELLQLTDTILKHRNGEKRGVRFADAWYPSRLPCNLMAWARYIDFEPEWHMKKRGDTRKLPNIKGKDLWGHLRKLYTDPEQSRMRTPENIKKIAHLYPGYVDCCKRAIRHGQEELKRIHGADVDLTPLVDKRKDDASDMVNLFNLITSGEMAAVLGSFDSNDTAAN